MYAKQPRAKGEALVKFAKWLTHEGQAMLADETYAALPEAIIAKSEKLLDTVKFE